MFGPGKKSDGQWAQSVLTNIVRLEEWRDESTDVGTKGTHSLRKGAVSHCSRNRIPKEYTDARGRWSRGPRMVSSVYEDLYLPVPDAMCSQALAGPKGAAKYVLKDDAADIFTVDFMKRVVVPQCYKLFGAFIGERLGLALLFAIFEGSARVPGAMKTSILSACEQKEWDLTRNPVDRVRVVVMDNHGTLTLEELPSSLSSHPTQATPAAGGVAMPGNNDWLAWAASVTRTVQENHEMSLAIQARRHTEVLELLRNH